MEWGQIRVSFEQQRDDADDVRAGEAVAGQALIAAAEPGGADVDARRGQFDDLAVAKAEMKRIGLFRFRNRDQRGLKNGRK